MAHDEVSRLLSGLKISADRLNAATDVINAELQSAESEIREMNIGLECWPRDCELERRRDAINGIFFCADYLGFARVAKSWCLAVRTMSGSDSGDFHDGEYRQSSLEPEGEPSALLKASRPTRIAALEKLPQLIAALKEQADQAAIPTQAAARIIERSNAPKRTEPVGRNSSIRTLRGRAMITQLRPDVDDRYRDNCLKQIEGHLTSYIAQANDDPKRIIKTIRTIMAKSGMTRDELAKMFDEIYPGSVRSFLQAPVGSHFGEQGPVRDERFKLLKTGLLS